MRVLLFCCLLLVSCTYACFPTHRRKLNRTTTYLELCGQHVTYYMHCRRCSLDRMTQSLERTSRATTASTIEATPTPAIPEDPSKFNLPHVDPEITNVAPPDSTIHYDTPSNRGRQEYNTSKPQEAVSSEPSVVNEGSAGGSSTALARHLPSTHPSLRDTSSSPEDTEGTRRTPSPNSTYRGRYNNAPHDSHVGPERNSEHREFTLETQTLQETKTSVSQSSPGSPVMVSHFMKIIINKNMVN